MRTRRESRIAGLAVIVCWHYVLAADVGWGNGSRVVAERWSGLGTDLETTIVRSRFGKHRKDIAL